MNTKYTGIHGASLPYAQVSRELDKGYTKLNKLIEEKEHQARLSRNPKEKVYIGVLLSTPKQSLGHIRKKLGPVPARVPRAHATTYEGTVQKLRSSMYHFVLGEVPLLRDSNGVLPPYNKLVQAINQKEVARAKKILKNNPSELYAFTKALVMFPEYYGSLLQIEKEIRTLEEVDVNVEKAKSDARTLYLMKLLTRPQTKK